MRNVSDKIRTHVLCSLTTDQKAGETRGDHSRDF